MAVTGTRGIKFGSASTSVEKFKDNTGFGGNGIASGVGQAALKRKKATRSLKIGGSGVSKLFAGLEDCLVVEAVSEARKKNENGGDGEIAVEGNFGG